jgi:hypothetical protein
VKTLPTVVSAQQKNELAALAAQNGIPLESILRHNGVQNRFHTAKAIWRHRPALTS